MKEKLILAKCRFMASYLDAISLVDASEIGIGKCTDSIMVGMNAF